MEKRTKQTDQAKVKEESAKLESQLAELQRQLAETTDKREQEKLVEKIKYTRGKIKQVKTGQRMSRQEKRDLAVHSFIAPNFIGSVVFTLIPIIFTFALVFAKWDGNNVMELMGLSSFSRIFTNGRLIAPFKNTILHRIGIVPLILAAVLGLVVVLDQEVKGGNLLRTVSFFPYVASPVAVAVVWSMLFGSQKSGPVSMLLYNLGVAANHLLKQPADKDWVMFTITLFSVWKNMGYYMVIYLAGSQGVNVELCEAASLDEANTRQRSYCTTWPQLRPTTFFVTIILAVNCFKVYDIVYMLAGGSNGILNKSAIVLACHIYEEAFRDWNLGYTSAATMVLFLLVLTVALIQFRSEKEYVNQEDDVR